ncbi:rhomboid family intramembrane serine protease [Pseudogracilibacillus auburnensis]|uniref:Rhomboid family peptidase n=1 Tax=Pseudogracilibacillus auburnensis TaxID=1494959 RepID=A0A2V3VZY3_9BACI|nr:rhomboid family intramembrane serine protease [Pseudogracilibacillus auburnensis]MBO1003520.1 rhomboid family intramembrane serine protease [Pseudogracilibacillus auburnensis]PXW86494.1 rhomboid family peptidase [Pseudogracilibacillus auburnensis]
MYITEQYYMYRLAYDLITEDNFEMLHMNMKTNELWLEKKERKVSKIIRFVHQGFDWKNHLKSDIASVFQRVKSMNRFFTGKNINIYNVYVTSHEPVDDWEVLKKPMILKEKKPLKMNVFYVTEDNIENEQMRLLRQIDSSVYHNIQLPTELEQEEYVEKYKSTLHSLLYDKNKEIENVFTYGKPRFTYIFIVLNIFMFLMLELNGGSTNIDNLIQSGAKYNPAIIDGEWWRIVSSMFLHIGMLHLIMNMIALYYLGMAVERIYGSTRFLIIYFLAGIGGGLTSFAFNIHVAAGASGALFGLFGALLFFGVIYKHLFFQTMGKSVILILAINLVFGFMVPQIDMGAHLGGLIMGFIASCITFLPQKRNIIVQIFSSVVYLVLLVYLLLYGIQMNTLLFG